MSAAIYKEFCGAHRMFNALLTCHSVGITPVSESHWSFRVSALQDRKLWACNVHRCFNIFPTVLTEGADDGNAKPDAKFKLHM